MILEQRDPPDLAQVHNQCFTFSLFAEIFFQDNYFLFKSVDDFYHLPHASWLSCTCVPIKRLGPTVRCVCFLESTFLFATEFMPHNLMVLFTYANRLARKWSVINKYYSVPNSRKKDKIKLVEKWSAKETFNLFTFLPLDYQIWFRKNPIDTFIVHSQIILHVFCPRIIPKYCKEMIAYKTKKAYLWSTLSLLIIVYCRFSRKIQF